MGLRQGWAALLVNLGSAWEDCHGSVGMEGIAAQWGSMEISMLCRDEASVTTAQSDRRQGHQPFTDLKST